MAATSAHADIRRPLRVSEVLAASVQLYGRQALPYLGLGAVQGAAFLLAATVLPFPLGLVPLSIAFGAVLAVTARMVAGDRPGEAVQRVLADFPLVLALGFFVGIPFSFAASYFVLQILAAAWLALTAFAIPVAMIEDGGSVGHGRRLAYAIQRASALGRAAYLHSLGVVVLLIVVTLLLGVVLALALFSFADNGQVAAVAISQIVLSPIFFIGLAVLYFEQNARTLDGGRRARAR